jgi:cytochrome c-type biogenesis protein CcmH
LPDRSTLGGLLLLLLITTGIAAQPTANFDSAGYEEAITTILCDCGCHPQSVKACACGRAAEMRDDMRKMIVAGMSGQGVIDDYVAKNGEQIRIAPVASGFNLVAWIGPLIGLVLACFGLVWLIRRWSREVGSGQSDSTPPFAEAAGDDPYREKLRAAMEKME